MNIVLFEPEETTRPLSRADPRAIHILQVLRRQLGDGFDAGLIDGPRGKAIVSAITDTGLTLSFQWGEAPPALPPLSLLIGLPRPQTARKILQETTAMGVGALWFAQADRGEPSYANSTLWSAGEWRRLLVAGAAQAFCTRLPVVRHGVSIPATLDELPPETIRIALDNYEASAELGSTLKASGGREIVLAIGPERGWSAQERDLFRARGFTLAHLGSRVLRTETAAIAATAIIRSCLGWS